MHHVITTLRWRNGASIRGDPRGPEYPVRTTADHSEIGDHDESVENLSRDFGQSDAKSPSATRPKILLSDFYSVPRSCTTAKPKPDSRHRFSRLSRGVRVNEVSCIKRCDRPPSL